MPGPSQTPPENTAQVRATQPLIGPSPGGRGLGPTLGEDVGAADEQADRQARAKLDAQMANARKPPTDSGVRGAGMPARTPITPDLDAPGPKPAPGPTPGAPVPPATTDLHNGE